MYDLYKYNIHVRAAPSNIFPRSIRNQIILIVSEREDVGFWVLLDAFLDLFLHVMRTRRVVLKR